MRSFPGMLRAWVLAAVLATGQGEPSRQEDPSSGAAPADAPVVEPEKPEEEQEKRGLEGIGIPDAPATAS